MQKKTEYQKYSRLLWESSNIDPFIERLEKWIVDYGPIKRSQTVLDETAVSFSESKRELETLQETLQKKACSLHLEIQNRTGKLVQSKNTSIENIRKILEERFEKLANQEALDFAEKYYGEKKDKIPDLWNTYIEQISFENSVQEAIQEELLVFTEKAQDVIDEFFEDMRMFRYRTFDIPIPKIPLQIDIKTILRIGGIVSGTAGIIIKILASASLGNALIAIGSAIAIAAQLFTSKAKKRQDAINIIHDQIKKSIREQKDKLISEISDQLRSEMTGIIEGITEIYKNCIDEIEHTFTVSERIDRALEKEISRINTIYAWRIIQFLNNKSDPYSSEMVKNAVDDVNRKNGIIEITAKSEVYTENTMEGIIADKVKNKGKKGRQSGF